MRAKYEDPELYKKLNVQSRMRSQMKNWRDNEAKLLNEKKRFEMDLAKLKLVRISA